MIKIHPVKLVGNWQKGYALDLHTVSSRLLGSDEFGHEVFETTRSEMGELLYRLKYKNDKTVLPIITETVVEFLNNTWKISPSLTGIVAAPPSKNRAFQPVLALANAISIQLNLRLYHNLIRKAQATPELKNIYDYQARLKLLAHAYTVKSSIIAEQSILLFDDLYRSGATLQALTAALYEQGHVKKVYVLTLTKTRSHT